MTVPDFPAFAARAVAGANLADSPAHGEAHWTAVAWTGLALIKAGVPADPEVVLLFGLFHDSQRHNEYADGGHGERGAAYAADMLEGILDRDRLATLRFACSYHTNGTTSLDPTVGCCWDADRLNLWRVGIEPDPAFLSTEQARSMLGVGQFLRSGPGWEALGALAERLT